MKYVLILFWVLCTQLSFAQVRIGLFFGAGSSEIGFKNYPASYYSPVFSYDSGIIFKSAKGKSIFTWGLAFQRRAASAFITTTGQQEYTSKLKFYSGQMSFGYRFTKNLSLSAGPHFNLLADVQTSINTGNLENIPEYYDNIFEVAGAVEARYKISKNIEVNLRAARSLNSLHSANIYDEFGFPSGETSKYYSWYVHTGFSIYIFRKLRQFKTNTISQFLDPGRTN